MITMIINYTPKPTTRLRPGIILRRELTDPDDFEWADGKIQYDVIVVAGNERYKNGRRLKLFLDPSS